MNGERGETTLIGLLVAMTIMLGVLGATLDTFAGSQQLNQASQARNDAQARVRVAVEALARELRNVASPSDLVASTGQDPIDWFGDDDLVFKMVDPSTSSTSANAANIARLRYCVERTSGRLYRQQQTWTSASVPAMPSRTACPGTGWDAGGDRVVADGVTNYANGLSRAMFTYNAAAAKDISSLRVDLHLDLDPARGPAETVLSTGVFLRNQNRYPKADFTSTFSADRKTLLLNGSISTDPDGDSLEYCWYDATAASVPSPPKPCAAGAYVGTGVVTELASTAGQTHRICLEVWDGGLLSNKSCPAAITNG